MVAAINGTTDRRDSRLEQPVGTTIAPTVAATIASCEYSVAVALPYGCSGYIVGAVAAVPVLIKVVAVVIIE